MKTWRKYCLATALILGTCWPAQGQSGTPEAALEEMVTATSPEAVIKHLPVVVEEYLKKLPPQAKAGMLDQIVVARQIEREGKKLRRSGDGSNWEAVGADGNVEVAIRVKGTFISGADALVPLEIQRENESLTVLLGLRLEEGEWRLTEAGEWHSKKLEDTLLPREGTDNGHGTATESNLRTLTTALVTYISTYPESGYPTSLRALSGTQDEEPSPDHAMLIDPSWLEDPVIRDGYEFRYTLNDSGAGQGRDARWQITATPVELGKAGSRSFFTDQTGVIRVTSESRPANEHDPPLK